MLSKFKSYHSIFLILFLSLLVRTVHLNQSLWLDEAAQALESIRPLSQQFDIVDDFQPPLFHLIVHFFTLVGKSDWWLRLASVIPGLLTIFYAYKIARDLFNENIANLTGIFGALSAYHYYFSQELRPYSLAAMFGTISMYYYLKFIRSKENNLNWKYILASTAGIYSTYVLPFLLLSQLISTVILYKKKLKAFIKHQILVILLFAPWLPMFWKQLQGGIHLKNTYVGWSTAVSLPWFKSLPLTAVRFIIGMIRVDPNPLQLLFFGTIIIGLGLIFIKISKTKDSQNVLYWLTAPSLLAFLLSFFIPVLEPKRLLFSIPALWILLAIMVNSLKSKPMLKYTIVAVYALPLLVHFFDPNLKREDWKSSVNFVQSVADQNSIAFFAFPQPFGPYRWYEDGSVATASTNSLSLSNINSLDESAKEVLLYDEVFVYEYLMDLSDPDRLVFKWLVNNGYQEVGIKDFHGVGFVYIFQKQQIVALSL